ncbi:hypothetical protein MKX08_007752 [Trichoderma sp. CBMAI-0020]|nr:hypothetical protein MKX08_007752 [Trichoderma sp. CBMAI-0020]
MAHRTLLPREVQRREPPAEEPTRAKRRLISAACNICKKKKIKCNGRRPVCGYCEQANHPCQYAVPEGMTVRQALVQQNEGLTERNRVLYTAFEKLRDEGRAAADVLRRIREAPSTDAAISSMSDAMLLLPSSSSGVVPSTKQSISATDSNPVLRQAFFYSPKASRRFEYRKARAAVTFGWPKLESLGVNDGLNGMVVQVATDSLPISKWTRVSSDDVHLTHLFNLFWTWDNTISRVIDRDIFLADLKNMASSWHAHSASGGEFCSSFMVNALLALACMYSSDEEDLTVPGDAMTRGRAFADEAYRLLEKEKTWSRPSLTLTQGMAFMWVYESNIGDGALGLRLLDDLYLFYSDFAFHDQAKHGYVAYLSSSVEATRWKAKSHLAWGFYCVDAKIGLSFSRPLKVKTPAITRCAGDSGSSPFGNQISPGSWFAYPVSVEAHDSHYGDVFQAECNLAGLAEEILLFREANNIKVTSPNILEGVENLYRKLVIWKQSLPECLYPSSTEIPSVLMLHNTYDAVVLKLLEGLRNAPRGIGGQNLETLRIAHATAIMSGVWIFRSLYALGREYIAIPCCFAAATAVLDYLSPGTVQVDTFIRACQALSEMGALLPLASSFLEMIQRLVSLHKVTLPRNGLKYLVTPQSRQGRAYTSVIRVSTAFGDEASGIMDGNEGPKSFDLTFSDLIFDREVAEMETD